MNRTMRKKLYSAVYKICCVSASIPILGRRKYCNICGRHSFFFMPYGIRSEVFKELDIIGGGRRKECDCPFCHSHDRFRWCYCLLKEHTNILSDSCTVLHIAPETQIALNVSKNSNCQYYTGDITPGRAEYVVDVTDMKFKDEFFDYIIINHVLEHIPDEKKAMMELKRCLKREGMLILSFPICRNRETLEDPTVVTEADRLRYYGQVDHCRIYGMDCADHLKQYGFDITSYMVRDCLDQEQARRLSLIPDDTVYFCRKL